MTVHALHVLSNTVFYISYKFMQEKHYHVKLNYNNIWTAIVHSQLRATEMDSSLKRLAR